MNGRRREEDRIELGSKYAGKMVVIASNKIIDVYNTDREAIQETSKTTPLGSVHGKIYSD